MKRQAIIIGGAFSKGNPSHLNGVAEDMSNYKKLLLSANGGAWRNDEIIELPDPSYSEVKRALLHQEKSDYALTIFSGHGARYKSKNYLCLTESQSVEYNKLFTDAQISCLIMDACRNRFNRKPTPGLYGLDLQFEMRYKNVTRIIYDKVLSSIPSGKVAVFSTSENERAWDTEDGGAFTVELLSQITEWINSNSACFLPLGNALKNVKAGLNDYDYPQVPRIKYTHKNLLVLPLATNPYPVLNQSSPRVNDTLSKNQRRSNGTDIYILS